VVSVSSLGMTIESTEDSGSKENSMESVHSNDSGFYISANGVEKKGDWHDGKRICWLDGDGNKVNNDGASDADVDV
jgi:hypothetical protein